MKDIAKAALGNVLLAAATNPIGRACLNYTGYECVPEYMLDFAKAAGKQEDIRSYPVFGSAAAETISDSRCCLHYDRLYTIYQCLRMLDNPGGLNTVEVGVYRGGTSKFISTVLRKLGKKFTHHGFDTFEGHSDSDISDCDLHKASQFNNTSYAEVSKYLEKHIDISLYKGRFEDTCRLISGKLIDFAHIDVDIYAPTFHALRFIVAHMDMRGTIVVDDYASKSCPGVKKAVDEFVAADGRMMAFHLLTGQCLLVKVK